MMGNGGREREPHPVAGEGPGRARPVPSGHAGLEGFERDRFRLAPQAGGERVQEARNRPVKRAVGHHRGHHRAHSRVGVGLADRLQSFRGRRRELEAEVVGGGTSLAHHLHRSDEGREVLVLESAAAGDPGRRVQQQLQGPTIADTLGEVVVAVGVRVDEARHEHPAGCVERGGVAGRGHPRRPISRTVSLSTRMSAGSAACRPISSSRPPRMIVFMIAPCSGIVSQTARRPPR